MRRHLARKMQNVQMGSSGHPQRRAPTSVGPQDPRRADSHACRNGARLATSAVSQSFIAATIVGVSAGSTPKRMPDISEPRPRPSPPPSARPKRGKQADTAEDQRADVRALRAEREPDTELARALRDGVAGHAEDADAGEHEGQRREGADQTGSEARQRQRVVVARVDRLGEVHRHRRVDRGQRGADRRQRAPAGALVVRITVYIPRW